MVDNLVTAYTGDRANDGFKSYSNFGSNSSNRSSVPGESNGPDIDCPKYAEVTQERFERLDLAEDQIVSSQAKITEFLDCAVQAQMEDKPVNEKALKKAEADQDKLTAAQGKITRTRQTLDLEQANKRSSKNSYLNSKQAAEQYLQQKFDSANPELRDHMLKKLQPMVNNNATARDNHQLLDAAAAQYMKSDVETQRLAKQGQPDTSKTGLEDAAVAGTKSGAKTKPSEVRKRLVGDRFQQKLKHKTAEEQAALIQKKIKPLADKSPNAALEIEGELTRKLSEAKVREATSSNMGLQGKTSAKKQEARFTLLKAKHERQGRAHQNSDPLSKAVDTLDTDSVRQTSETLKQINPESVTSLVDLERKFGRNVTEVRTDLEQLIGRGGKSAGKARTALKDLDKVVRRSKLMSQGDTWGALKQSVSSTGPNLGKFLGVSDNHRSADAQFSNGPRPLRNGASNPDAGLAKSLLKRLRQGGAKAEHQQDFETLKQLRQFGA